MYEYFVCIYNIYIIYNNKTYCAPGACAKRGSRGSLELVS